jgi:type I restriction enzyme S subunit
MAMQKDTSVIDGLKPYTDYKDSGLPWLGQVPAHWEVRRIKTVLREVDRRSSTGRETLLSLRMQAGLVDHHALGGKPIPPSALIGYKRVMPGEIVMNRMRASSGLFAAATTDGLVSPDYAIFRPVNQLNAAYAVHLFRTPAMTAIFRLESTGLGTGESGFLRLYSDQFDRLAVPTPPIAEQTAIVRFLNWANGRLERAIRAKRKVIALLTEQRQAVIRRAVTCGVDPAVPLKTSGIPWLGDIPQHWNVSRVKSEFFCLNTKRVPLNSVERGRMTLRAYDYYGASGVIDKVDDYLFDDELLLIAEDGANLVLRNLPIALIARGKFWVNNHAHILKPKRGNLIYLAHLLETLNFKPWISGAAQPKLTKDRLMSVSIAVAPPVEQDTIVLHTERQTRPLSATIDHLEREVGLLREYRVRLATDVVTGKVDVRQAATRLPVELTADIPDEVNEPEGTELSEEEAEA